MYLMNTAEYREILLVSCRAVTRKCLTNVFLFPYSPQKKKKLLDLRNFDLMEFSINFKGFSSIQLIFNTVINLCNNGTYLLIFFQ